MNDAGIEALKVHLEECKVCIRHMGHMPIGFCNVGIKLFEEMDGPLEERKPVPVVKPVTVMEGDTLLVKWYLLDGGTYEQKVTIPPKATRQAQEHNAPAGQ